MSLRRSPVQSSSHANDDTDIYIVKLLVRREKQIRTFAAALRDDVSQFADGAVAAGDALLARTLAGPVIANGRRRTLLVARARRAFPTQHARISVITIGTSARNQSFEKLFYCTHWPIKSNLRSRRLVDWKPA